MEEFVRSTVALVQEHRTWGVPIVFVLAFCESFAFVSLFVPATAVLLGLGGLIAAADMAFWPIWMAAGSGAVAGDWAAYELALRFRADILHMRPFAGRAELMARGIDFFKRWGLFAVFVGR